MKLVIVDWVDSHAGRGWQDIPKIEASAQPLFCRSVGWILSKTKDVIVIVPHLSSDSIGGQTLQGAGDMIIPMKAVLKITNLYTKTG